MTTETSPSDLNPAVALSKIAATKDWCSNLYCSMCAHAAMRYALREIAGGVLPGTEAWALNGRWPFGMTAVKKKYGNFPIDASIPEWNIRHEHALSAIMADLDIAQMANHVTFPEFFYHLGIYLHYIGNEERRSRRVTQSWGTQILTLFDESLEDDVKSELRQLLASKDVLAWKHLQLVQNSLNKKLGDRAEKVTPPGIYYVMMKSRIEYNLGAGRGVRWKSVAEVLTSAQTRKDYPPQLYAYTFLPSAAYLVIKTYNAEFFTKFISAHSYQLMHENVKRVESQENQRLISEHGFWHDNIVMEPVTNIDALKRYQSTIENMPVDLGYVQEPAHWKWSSANANNTLTISQINDHSFSGSFH